MLSIGTALTNKEALHLPHCRKMLLSFKDIRDNNYQSETSTENGVQFLCISSYECGQKRILEKMKHILNGLYITTICLIESHYLAGLESGLVLENFALA